MISIKPIKNIVEFYQNHMQMQILTQIFHPISRCLYSLLNFLWSQHSNTTMIINHNQFALDVATLTLGSRPRQKACKVVGQKEAQEWKKMSGNEPSHSQGNFHCGNLEFRWTHESSKRNDRGQNPMDWKVFYIIENLLKRRCLKWVAWPIWTFKTQVMAKRKVMSQIGNLTMTTKS